METELANLFIDASVRRLKQFSGRIKSCLDHLSDDQVWLRGSENENAVGNLVLHLAGNVRQWIVSGVGGKPDIRARDREFQARGGASREELWERLEAVVEDAEAVLMQVTPARLLDTVTIQAYNISVLEAIYHVIDHFAQHTGQIVFATKMMTHDDLGFYRHIGKAHHETTP